MSQVQNYSCLDTKTIAPPIAFLGLALLAGRFIQYFPKTSQRDLLIAAGAASVTSAIYDCAVHKPDHNYLQTLLGKAATIAVATLGTALTAKALNGRADLSFRSIARFGAIEFVAAAITTFATRESSLQRQHSYYTTHQKEWRHLEANARTDLFKQFYEAGLPSISLFEGNLEGNLQWLDGPQKVLENLKEYSRAQLSWYREIFQQHNIYPKTPEQYFNFMERCQETGIAMLWCKLPQPQRKLPEPQMMLDEYDLDEAYDPFDDASPVPVQPLLQPTQEAFLQSNPRCVDMLYREFQQTPIYRFYCEMVDYGHQPVNFEAIFASKAPLPTLEQAMQQLDAAQVETMDPSLLQIWHEVLRQQEPELLDSLSEPVQAAFVQRFFEYEAFDHIGFPSPGDLSWINALSQDDIDHLSENQGQWIDRLLQENSDVVIEFHIAHALNTQYQMHLLYHLTHKVVALLAQGNETLLAALKEQFGGYGRVGDYGFSKLSFSDQKALKDLFGEKDRLLLPPYQLSAEAVVAAQQDPTLLQELKEQFEGSYRGEDYGFLEISQGDQATLRVLFDEDAHLLPYKVTSALVAQAQDDEQLVDHLIGQFNRAQGRYYYGFYELPPQDQATLREFFDQNASLLPYRLTSALVAKAEQEPELVKALIAQFNRAGYGHNKKDFGFSLLSKDDQDGLRKLFDQEAYTLPQMQ